MKEEGPVVPRRSAPRGGRRPRPLPPKTATRTACRARFGIYLDRERPGRVVGAGVVDPELERPLALDLVLAGADRLIGARSGTGNDDRLAGDGSRTQSVRCIAGLRGGAELVWGHDARAGEGEALLRRDAGVERRAVEGVEGELEGPFPFRRRPLRGHPERSADAQQGERSGEQEDDQAAAGSAASLTRTVLHHRTPHQRAGRPGTAPYRANQQPSSMTAQRRVREGFEVWRMTYVIEPKTSVRRRTRPHKFGRRFAMSAITTRKEDGHE